MKAPEHLELPGREPRGEGFIRFLAVGIVLCTLAIASVEFLRTVDEKEGDYAGARAEAAGIQSQQELNASLGDTLAQIDAFTTSQEARARAATALQQSLVGAAAPGSDAAKTTALDQERWQALTALAARLTPITPDGPLGPVQDNQFPNSALSVSEREAQRLFAVQDAATTLRNQWSDRLGKYAVVLTLLAVSTYLFGLAVTLADRRVQTILAGVGVVLVVLSTAQTARLQVSRPSDADPAAAEAYADGTTAALQILDSNDALATLRTADADLTRAIALRPDFPYAFVARAGVRFALGSPQLHNLYQVVSTGDALRAEGADAQRAYDLGLRTTVVLNELAANRILTALQTDTPALYAAGIGYLDEALKLNDAEPLYYYNKAVALLAEGDHDGSAAAYAAAIDRTLYTDVVSHKPRDDVLVQEAYVDAALTELDLLAQKRPDLAASATLMKEFVVTRVETPNPGPGGVRASDVQIAMLPDGPVWQAHLANFDPARNRVTAIYSYNDPQQTGWGAIDGISGPTQVNPAPGATDAATFGSAGPLLRDARRCAPDGAYRVDVYVDGHAVGSAQTAQLSFGGVTGGALVDVHAAICHPASWHGATGPSIHTGLSNGYVSADGRHGVDVLRFVQTLQPAALRPDCVAAGGGAAQQQRCTVSRSMRDLALGAGSGVVALPGTPTFAADLTINASFTAARYSYTAPDGSPGVALEIDQQTTDGSVTIAVVYGTPDDFADPRTSIGNEVFASLTLLPG